MVTVRTTSDRVGTRRVWNEQIAAHYDYHDRPEWSRRDDGRRYARLQQDCADALVDASDAFEIAPESADGDESDSDDARAASESDEGDTETSGDEAA